MRFMRKTMAILLIAGLLASLSGCAGSGQAKPQLIIGCNEYAPYNYTDEDGDPAGMDVELAWEACARMGYEPVFRRIDWEQRDALLEAGEIDCLWSCYSMDGQLERYAWVGPYMNSRQVVAVLSDSPIETLSDLAGKSVAVRVGSKAETIFLEQSELGIPQVQVVYSLNTSSEIATALRNNYVDAVAGYGAAVREALNYGGADYRFLEEEPSHAALGIAFALGSGSQVRENLRQALKEMLEDGTTARILTEYGVDIEKALGRIHYA